GLPCPPTPPSPPSTTLFRSVLLAASCRTTRCFARAARGDGFTPAPSAGGLRGTRRSVPLLDDDHPHHRGLVTAQVHGAGLAVHQDRKSTRLNSSHEWISYAV